MKRLFLVFTLSLLACFMLAGVASAKTVYLEEIPDELKMPNDTATHFVVFEEEKYFTGGGNTINGLNSENILADMTAAGIDSTKIGREYLTRFNFPANLNGTLITYVNLNSIKGNSYFKNVCGYVQLEGTVKQVHDMNQCVSQLRCFDFGKDSQVTTIPGHFANSANRLMSVKNFPRNLDSVGESAFNNCYGAFRGELYLNAKTIGISAFNNSISFLTGLVLGPNTQNIGRQSLCVRFSEFNYKPADNKAQLKYIEFQCDVSKVTFANQGNDTGSFYFTGNTRTTYSQLTCIILSHPDNAAKVTEGSVFNDFTADGVTVFFNDTNGLDDYVTTAHSLGNATISYDSFMAQGKLSSTCTKCTATEATAIPAIFKSLGYSVSTYGESSITVGYEINIDALKTYKSSTGNSLSYGIVATTKANLGTNAPLDENGDATVLEKGMVIKASIDNNYRVFNGNILGLTKDEYKSAELILCGYVIVADSDNNITKIAYLQDKECSADQIKAVVYNDLIPSSNQ